MVLVVYYWFCGVDYTPTLKIVHVVLGLRVVKTYSCHERVESMPCAILMSYSYSLLILVCT